MSPIYSKESSEIIADACQALNNKTRWDILESLLESDLHYIELQKKLGISSKKLDYHLKILIGGRLVEVYPYDIDEEATKLHDPKNVYNVSTFGELFVDGLFRVLKV